MRAAKYCVTRVEVLLNRSGPEPAAKAVNNLVEYSSPEMTSYCTLMSELAFSKSAMMALSMGMRGGCSCIHIRTVTCSAQASPVQATRPMIVERRISVCIVVSSLVSRVPCSGKSVATHSGSNDLGAVRQSGSTIIVRRACVSYCGQSGSPAWIGLPDLVKFRGLHCRRQRVMSG